MEEQERLVSRTAFPVILISAVVQGWALYGLYLAMEHRHWPATDPAWLTGLYAIALLVPATVQLLAEHIRKPVTGLLIALLAVAAFYMGWHNGGAVSGLQGNHFSGTAALFAFEMIVLWLLVLPFLQLRVLTGSWRPRYPVLFSVAWRNKLMLAEAGLFTGALWLLLMLWQELFHMLGINFFRQLFERPVFIYPVTSITFGMALHLIGSVERFTAIVLEQLLNVLKWLAIVAGLILALFTVALVFKLPGLVATGQRAIGAAWLLWLVSIIVLLVNAAYRDGNVDRPYPQWIANALRVVVPLTIVISLTAFYALYLRSARYGLTVERVWACIVAGAALLYSIGYGAAAIRGGRWMNDISRVNILAALTLIATIVLALTPVLSPYRLAAESQYRRALNPEAFDTLSYRGDSVFAYLRFDAGEYGLAKLRELAKVADNPRAAEIRKAAQASLAVENRWAINQAFPVVADPAERLASLRTFPAATVIEKELHDELLAQLSKPDSVIPRNRDVYGLFVDLNDDAVDEFLLISPMSAVAYERASGKWVLVGTLRSGGVYAPAVLGDDLADGAFSAEKRAWQDLKVGRRTFRFAPAR